MAALEHGFDHLETTFRAAAEAGPESEPDGGDGRVRLLGAVAGPDWLLLQQQGYAACSDDDVRDLVRRRYAQLYELVRDLSGADAGRLRRSSPPGC